MHTPATSPASQRVANMARINRSEFSANAALAASRGASAARKVETARRVRTFADILRRLPFLSTVAATAFLALAAAAVSVI